MGFNWRRCLSDSTFRYRGEVARDLWSPSGFPVQPGTAHRERLRPFPWDRPLRCLTALADAGKVHGACDQ